MPAVEYSASRMDLRNILRCPHHGCIVAEDRTAQVWRCKDGCTFQVVGEIPRFVPSQSYASSFGLQWNEFEKTQLDSFTGTTISRDRLTRIVGGSPSVFIDKLILEAGCGAGRFTEIMLSAGGQVFATDISSAVEANRRNCGHLPGYFVCQADVRALPVASDCFDVVICVGVIQHTPDPEETISALCRYLKPGGLLLMDHYSPGYPESVSRRLLRTIMLQLSPRAALTFCRQLVTTLWPIHTAIWRLVRRFPRTRRLRSAFLLLSPVVDYHNAYMQLGADRLREWAILDTHDTLTDRYKHLRSSDQIAQHLRACGMIIVETTRAGNGVEVRAVKEAAESATGSREGRSGIHPPHREKWPPSVKRG